MEKIAILKELFQFLNTYPSHPMPSDDIKCNTSRNLKLLGGYQ